MRRQVDRAGGQVCWTPAGSRRWAWRALRRKTQRMTRCPNDAKTLRRFQAPCGGKMAAQAQRHETQRGGSDEEREGTGSRSREEPGDLSPWPGSQNLSRRSWSAGQVSSTTRSAHPHSCGPLSFLRPRPLAEGGRGGWRRDGVRLPLLWWQLLIRGALFLGQFATLGRRVLPRRT